MICSRAALAARLFLLSEKNGLIHTLFTLLYFTLFVCKVKINKGV